MIMQAFAILGAIISGIGGLIGAQVLCQQLHPQPGHHCCPPLPPGQHFTGCTAAVRDA